MAADEADARRALDGDEFFPVFQPVVELRTGHLAGFEMLARWRHPQLGILTPDAFIPLLERTGLIHRLTRAMLDKAFAAPELAGGAFAVAVNISPTQLLGRNLTNSIQDSAARSGFALGRLVVEITESALLDDLQHAEQIACGLKALNCKLALDDFGTGYSSLRHLHSLPFDILKIDRSFVGSMTAKRESRKIVAAVVGLGQSLGLTTVAEGIETPEQANMLLWLGCDLGQGWLFGKPAPAVEIPRMIEEAGARAATVSPVPLDEDALPGHEALPAQRLAQLQAIYDGAPVGLCFLDRNFRYVSLNKRLAQLNGVPLAEHLGKTVAAVIPQVFPLVERNLKRALEGERIYGVEVQKPPPVDGGSGQTLMASYQPVRDEAGEVLGVSVAIMDISRRKRIEEALRESEDHYRHMVQLSPHIPWVLDADGEVIEASPRWEQITGQPMDEAMGSGWLKALHPDDVEPTREAIGECLRTKLPIDIEYRIRRPGGEWMWMRSRGAPRFGSNGEIVRIYGVVEEVDGHKQLSEEMMRCQAELRAAVDAVPVGLVLADADGGTVVTVNPAATEILRGAIYPGQRLSEYSRLPVTYKDGTPLRPEDFALVRAVLYGETVEKLDTVYAPAGSLPVPLTVSSHPILAHDGRLIGGILILMHKDSGA